MKAFLKEDEYMKQIKIGAINYAKEELRDFIIAVMDLWQAITEEKRKELSIKGFKDYLIGELVFYKKVLAKRENDDRSGGEDGGILCAFYKLGDKMTADMASTMIDGDAAYSEWVMDCEEEYARRADNIGLAVEFDLFK